MIEFGTKAETLMRMAAVKSTFSVPCADYCSFQEWKDDQDGVLTRLLNVFAGGTLAVRSSALVEDSAQSSMAGAFQSFLHISANRDELANAINAVFASYGDEICAEDQVLIQRMVEGVVISGVAMTRNPQDGAPYYIISYDDFSGRTDTITSGAHPHKTVVIHRFCPDVMINSPRVRLVLRLLRDIESIMGIKPMDIEFAVTADGHAYLLQVRPIATDRQWGPTIDLAVNNAIEDAERQLEASLRSSEGLYGSRAILANMPDWNPAEMIQSVPRPLAASLYRHLITRTVWSDARAEMGYRPLEGVELMRQVAGHAFIDVRASLNSLLPSGLSARTSEALVTAGLNRLAEEPRFHDKLEFELAITVSTPSFDNDVERIFPSLAAEAYEEFSVSLRALTNKLMSIGSSGSLRKAEVAVQLLEDRQALRSLLIDPDPKDSQLLEKVSILTSECIKYGTRPFAILARHGFIAQSWLRALEKCGALSSERCEELKQSISTVASDLSGMMAKVQAGTLAQDQFHLKFGHLRPGTYDIESPRYVDRRDLFSNQTKPTLTEANDYPFILTIDETAALNKVLASSGVTSIDANGLVEYIQRATSGREWAKLIFTRNLSDMLELIALWGSRQGFNREDMSFVELQWILDELYQPGKFVHGTQLAQMINQNREKWEADSSVNLPHILLGKEDLFVVPLQRSLPNFVTRKAVEGPVVSLENTSSGDEGLSDKVVCIQSADPGFDWIFSRGIAGLVTLYGGPNSHMAIRCTEFGLPAAIGVGQELFARIVREGYVRLECGKKLIQPGHS